MPTTVACGAREGRLQLDLGQGLRLELSCQDGKLLLQLRSWLAGRRNCGHPSCPNASLHQNLRRSWARALALLRREALKIRPSRHFRSCLNPLEDSREPRKACFSSTAGMAYHRTS